MNFTDYEHIVVGPGALGLALAALLLKAKGTVRLVGRAGAATLPELPIQLRGDIEAELTTENLATSAFDSFSVPQAPCCYWICVKAYSLDEALREIDPGIRAGDLVVLLSNGLSIFLQASELVRQRCQMVRLLAEFGVRRIAPGDFFVSGTPKFLCAAPDRSAGALETITTELSSKASVLCELRPNVVLAEWEKALVNLIVNTVCTVLDQPNKILLENDSAQNRARKIHSEVLQIAAAEGFDLSGLSFEGLLDRIRPHGENINSTLSDLRAGRPTEIEYLLGRALRIARAYELKAPACEAIYEELGKKIQLAR